MVATVLVVEDELKLRELLRSHLERAGYAVLGTGSGAEAISLARSAAPELVVLDLCLPDIPGEDVALDIRDFSDMAILMLTAKTAEEDRTRGTRSGCRRLPDQAVQPSGTGAAGAGHPAAGRSVGSVARTS